MNKAKTKTDFKYWYDSTTAVFIYNCCAAWFGINLNQAQEKEVHEMLKVYPAPDEEEAIETVLLIYFANTK